MKRRITLLTFTFASVLGYSQQIGMFSHSFYKPMIYNPAFTGNSDATNILLISRAQWSDFKGAPQLNILSADGNLLNKKVGLGISIVSDRKGITNRIGGAVDYSYRFQLSEDMSLALGASIGAWDQSIDFGKGLVENASDPTLFTTNEHKTVLDANAGLAFYWKGLQFGVAVPQLLGNKVNYNDNMDVRTYYSQARHYMGSLAYKFVLSEDKGLSISPMAIVRFVPNAPFQYDGNLNFEWADKFWIGATYKSDYAVSANAGVHIHKQLSIGYSYDFIIGDIGKYAGMSHEIMLNFKFGKKKEEVVEQPKEVEKNLENAAYVQRMDSLQTQLAQTNAKIKQLSDQLAQQAKMQQQLPPQQTNTAVPVNDNANQNSAAVAASTNKINENGVWVVTNKTIDFKDDANHEPQKGFYVVVGTFVYRDFAQAEVQRFRSKGYGQANWVYYDAKQYNYVFISRVETREEAFQKVNQAKANGISDAWIQVLEK